MPLRWMHIVTIPRQTHCCAPSVQLPGTAAKQHLVTPAHHSDISSFIIYGRPKDRYMELQRTNSERKDKRGT